MKQISNLNLARLSREPRDFRPEAVASIDSKLCQAVPNP